MAIKLPDFLKSFKEGGAKSRIFIVFAAVIGIGFIVFIATQFFGGGETTTGPSKVAGAPSGLQSVPGGKMTPEFYRAVSQANTQAAQQAQISGGSAVPTLINVPGEQASTQAGGCCQGEGCAEEYYDITGVMADLVKNGKLTQDDSTRLQALVKNNVCFDEFSSTLTELVKQDRMNPDVARRLFQCYKKYYQHQLIVESSAGMDNLIKSGQLSLDVAGQLLALQKTGILLNNYSNELNRQAAGGKISQQAAAQLLLQLTQQAQREEVKNGACALNQLAKTGALTAEVATQLANLQKRNLTADQYAAELQRLVSEGKITPETAAKLLNDYKNQQAKLSTATAASIEAEKAVREAETQALAAVDDLLKSGKISSETAELVRKAILSGSCKDLPLLLAKESKVSQADIQKLTNSCQRLSGVRQQAKRLAQLEQGNATLAEYTEELKRAVKSGTLTPEQAARMLQAYQATLAAKTGTAGVGPTPPSGIEGSAEFARLQQQVQAEGGAAATPTPELGQFQAASDQANVAEQQAREERIATIMSNMSNQAQQLLTAWQPTRMHHEEGAPPEVAKLPGSPGTGEASKATSEKGVSDESARGSGYKETPPIIKSGTILFAVLDTAVNSDYPDTPVLATIVQGQYSGAKLLGKMAIASTGIAGTSLDKVSLTFNLMNMDTWPNSKKVTAFAIDPDTARSVMASKADYHYLKRYGALFASSFVSGYASAIMQSGSTKTTGVFGTTSTTPPLGAQEKIAVGLGQIGTALSTAAQSYVNTPTTVEVNAGVGLGILFMEDVKQ